MKANVLLECYFYFVLSRVFLKDLIKYEELQSKFCQHWRNLLGTYIQMKIRVLNFCWTIQSNNAYDKLLVKRGRYRNKGNSVLNINPQDLPQWLSKDVRTPNLSTFLECWSILQLKRSARSNYNVNSKNIVLALFLDLFKN